MSSEASTGISGSLGSPCSMQTASFTGLSARSIPYTWRDWPFPPVVERWERKRGEGGDHKRVVKGCKEEVSCSTDTEGSWLGWVSFLMYQTLCIWSWQHCRSNYICLDYFPLQLATCLKLFVHRTLLFTSASITSTQQVLYQIKFTPYGCEFKTITDKQLQFLLTLPYLVGTEKKKNHATCLHSKFCSQFHQHNIGLMSLVSIDIHWLERESQTAR